MTHTRLRVMFVDGEGYYPQAKPPYKDWSLVTKNETGYGLATDVVKPYATQILAAQVCTDYYTWNEGRPAEEVFYDVPIP